MTPSLPPAPHLSAREAAALLGVSVPTLYAYVSRGLVRSEAAGRSTRARRYRREDIDRLRERQVQRRDPHRAAERALRWGTPVLESALTLIDDGQLFYRGRPALALAETQSFESVAELLWGDEAAPALPGGSLAVNLKPWAAALAHVGQGSPAGLFPLVLPLAAQADPAAYDLRPDSVKATGRRIIRLLAAAAVHPQPLRGATVAQVLHHAWAPSRPEAARLLNAALVLCADHELNVSAFTARCVASAGATPFDVVIAGLAALRGTRHGGHTARVEALLDEVGQPARAARVLGERLQRGEHFPGFGHPLYPGGDPRGRRLLELAASAAPRSRAVRLSRAVVAEAARLLGEHPTLDFGLVVLSRALALPRGAPLALFAIGRTAGWIAHALEQYQLGTMIRPRAKYTGTAIRT